MDASPDRRVAPNAGQSTHAGGRAGRSDVDRLSDRLARQRRQRSRACGRESWATAAPPKRPAAGAPAKGGRRRRGALRSRSQSSATVWASAVIACGGRKLKHRTTGGATTRGRQARNTQAASERQRRRTPRQQKIPPNAGSHRPILPRWQHSREERARHSGYPRTATTHTFVSTAPPSAPHCSPRAAAATLGSDGSHSSSPLSALSMSSSKSNTPLAAGASAASKPRKASTPKKSGEPHTHARSDGPTDAGLDPRVSDPTQLSVCACVLGSVLAALPFALFCCAPRPVDDAEQLQELIDLIKAPPPTTDAAAAAAAGGTGTAAAATAAAAAPVVRASSGSKSSTSIPNSHSDSALPTVPSSIGSARSKRPKNAEESRLDAFLLRHSKSYEFVGEGYATLLTSLLEGRLLKAEWVAAASREHRLRVLRAVRVLSRDPSLQALFLRARPLGPLASSLRSYATEYFASASEPAYCAESVVEICSILKRVAAEEAQDKRIFELSFLASLVQLLAARDAQILQAVLVTLVNLSGSPMFVERAMELPVLEPLLAILDEFISLPSNAATGPSAGSMAPTPTGAGAPSAAASPASSSFSQSQPLSAAGGVRPAATPAVAAAAAPTYHFLSAELLDLLSEYHECRQEIHLLSGNAIFLRLLHKCSRDRGGSSNTGEGSSVGEQMALPILRCIANQALEPESSREIRFLGGIQLLLSLIAPMPDPSTATTPPQPYRDGRTSQPPPTSPPSDAMLIGACICLTQLALDDENAYQIRKVQGVYALGLLFLRGGVLPPSAVNAVSTPASRDVQAHACRALRFLYSVERNRKVFKRVFPSADLFAAFIDIGHYVHPLPAYEHLVDQMAEMSVESRRAMAQAFEEIKIAVFVAPTAAGGAGAALIPNNGSAASALTAAAAAASANSAAAAAANGSSAPSAPSSAASSVSAASSSLSSPPSIRGYQIQEILGKGAFGTVYQVAKENSDKLYAMKELSLREMQKAGATPIGVPAAAPNGAGGGSLSPDVARALAASTLKEVDILSQLDHPNIVRYYTSFFEGAYVYIVMELVEGSSLLDHINSFVEKSGGGAGRGGAGGGNGVAMSEESIWPIFIQLCLALCYMHMEKRVVHRDLTPSNIMINDAGRAKVTDFGLAKQTHNGTVLQSAVGTISFSCPEIIMHETYTDKADLWSLGQKQDRMTR